MLYQVFMEVTGISGANKNLELYEYDKQDKEKVIEEVILPYLKNEKLQFNGYFLNAENIGRIIVRTSEQPINVIKETLQSRVSRGVVWVVTKEQAFHDEDYTQDVTVIVMNEAKQRVKELQKGIQTKSTNDSSTKIDNKKIFIVHGHDEVVKLSVARLLERLGLEPVILHEQASAGDTIIEKIESYSDVGFAIALYTPCDLGKAKNDASLQMRTRQNVIFEHGYLIGKLGRSKVCALVKDDIEKPNDISGVVYINYDSGNGWHMDLFKELKRAGYDLDANKILW